MFNGDVTQHADQITARGSATRRWRIVALRERLDGTKITNILGYAEDRDRAKAFAEAERAALRGAHVYYEPIVPDVGGAA